MILKVFINKGCISISKTNDVIKWARRPLLLPQWSQPEANEARQRSYFR